MELTIRPKNDNNKSDADFDMEVFEWKENAKTVFIARRSTEEENKKLYLLFTDKCELSLKIKMK